MGLAAGCGTSKSLRYADAMQVPISSSERGQLAEVLRASAKHERFFFRDDSDYMRQTTNGQFTVYMTLYRPLESGGEWPEVQVVRYSKAATETRARIIDALRARWPKVSKIPILPDGGAPLAQDVVATPQGNKIRADKAGTYGIPRNSPLLAR
jgi:hypothetical protein